MDGRRNRLLPIYSEETGKWGKKGSENNIKTFMKYKSDNNL